jgi:hypothetical protein
MQLSDDDLREVFALSSSCTRYEREQVYDPLRRQFFGREDLTAEYDLTQERGEFARDALRAVLWWLRRHGYAVTRNGQVDDLAWVEEWFG